MCSKGGGSPPVPNSASTAFQSTTTPAPFATPLYQDFLNRANTLSQTPFNPAMQGQVAALNPTQTAAGSAIYNYGSSFPTLGQNISNLGMQAGNWDPAQVRAIESPYTEDVVNATQNWFNNQNAIQGNDLMSQAIRSGNAFGGDRAGAAQGVLAGQQQLAQAPVIAGLRQAGYTQALNEYNTLKQLGLAGAQTAMAGGQFGLQGLNAAMGWGSMQQAQQQREFDVAQQNAMMSSAYPFQTLNWYGAALGGIAPLLGAQTVGFNTPPEQSGLTAGLGAASAGIGLANAAFGSGTPASSGSSPEGQKRGGAVRRRARGGLVPVYVRHNGGIVPGLAYGGSADDDDDDQHEPAGPPEQASDRAQSEDYRPPQVGLPPRERAPAWGSQIGQLKTSSKQTTPSTFPGMGSSGSTQPQQKSDLEQGLNLATKALPLMTGLFALSDPRTKTDIQPAGRSESGVPLWGFRYKGDPKSYPKVVGAMAKDPVRLANGGSDDVDVLSDEDPDPVSPGQQYAADATGRATWFNPRNERGGYTYRDDSGRDWTDYGAQRLREGAHASGLPSTTPGIATPGRGDLGNWFEVNVGGRKGYAQKTDIGPSGVVDLNAPLASRMGFAPENVSGRVYARDLGRTRPSEADGDEDYGHGPGGLPQNRQGPGYAGGRDDEEQRSGRPGVMPTDQPSPDEGAGRAGPGAGARPTPDAGTGAVGRKIPGLAKPAPTFAQRLANDPFWQFGTALMAKPGLKRYPLQGVGAAAQVMSAQQMHERNRILDEKPQTFDDGKQLHVLQPDGSLVPTGLPSPKGIEARTKAPFAIETETPGPFGSTTKKKEYYKGYDEQGNPIPFRAPTQAAPQPQAPRIAPPAEGRPAPEQPPPALQQPAPRQMRQTEAPAAAPAAGPAAPAVPAGPSGWSQDPTTGNWRDKEGAIYDKTGKVLTPAPAAPAAAPPAAPGQQQQPPQQQPPAQTGAAGPDDTLKRVQTQWGSGAVRQGGEVTNPAALNRNEAALEGLRPDEQGIIKGIADYKLDPSKVFVGKSAALRAPALQKVQEYDPSYNMGQYAQRNATRKAFEATGVEARNIQSQDMAVQHAARAYENIDALGHTRIPKVNEAIATVGKQTGLTGDAYQKAVARINQDIHAVSNELMKVFRGGTGTPSEREAKRIADTLNVYDNPVALKEALKEGVELLYGRINATAYRYNDAMGPGYARPTESWMSPEGRTAVQRILQGQ
jgi:hypothetical protein